MSTAQNTEVQVEDNAAKKIMTFDIGNLDADLGKLEEATHKVDVMFDDDGEGFAGFVVVGRNSKIYQAIDRKIRAEATQRGSKRNKALDTTKLEDAGKLVDVVKSNQAREARACVVGFYGFTNNGEAVEFSAELVDRMFTKMPVWEEKVYSAILNDQNFMKV